MGKSDFDKDEFISLLQDDDVDISETLGLLSEFLNDKICTENLDKKIEQMERLYNGYEKYKQIERITKEEE